MRSSSYSRSKICFTSSVLLKNNRYHWFLETRSKQRAAPLASALYPRQHIPRGAPLFGGAGRDRTDDPLLAKQVLSQLSYSPVWQQLLEGGSGWIRTIDPRLIKTVL